MNELKSFNEDLVHKPCIVVLTKIDVSRNKKAARAARAAFEQEGFRVHEISALTGQGVDKLIADIVHTLKRREHQENERDEHKT